MKRMVFAFVLGTAFLCSHAQAAGPAGVAGVGAEGCATLTKTLAATPSLMTQTYYPWAQGYMSGVNGVFIANSRPYREIAGDPAGQQKFIANYCVKNPAMKMLDAVIALYQSRPIAR
jgi:hypothetical protein